MRKDTCPILSVVITCYNYGRFLNGCIQSVMAQTFSNLEVIVIDDGSTDDTRERVKKFGSNVIYIWQPNSGQAKAKNRGIKESKGEFIAFLDADDLWVPEKIEKQINLFSDNQVGVVYSRQSFIDENGEAVIKPKRRKTMEPKRGIVTQDLFMDNFIPFSSSVVRRECFEQLGGFDESLQMGIDWDLWLRFSTKYLFDYVDEPLLIYRTGHSDQMSKNAVKRQRCSDRIMENFVSNYPGIIKAEVLSNAKAFTYCNRGLYFRIHNLSKSSMFFLKAIKTNPLWLPAYKGLAKNIIWGGFKLWR